MVCIPKIYPRRRLSSGNTFRKPFQRLAGMCSLAPETTDRDRVRAVRSPCMEERVLRKVHNHPTVSVQRIAAANGLVHSA